MRIRTLLVALAATACLGALGQQPGAFAIGNIVGTPDSSVEVEVSMNNGDTSAIAYQCDVVLPTQAQVIVDEYGDADVWTSSRTSKHIITANVIRSEEDTATYVLRVVCYSDKNRVISGSDGPIFGFGIRLGDDIGSYPVAIDKIIVTDENRKEIGDFTCAGATVTIKDASSLQTLYDDAHDGDSYDIMGRRTSHPSNGLYIMGRKKVFVK